MVTYQPDAGLADRVARIAALVRKVIIVDNRSVGQAANRINQLARDYVEVIGNSQNLGVAAALNQGMLVARAEGCRWVFTFDQDTVVRENLFSATQAVYDSFPDKERISVIGSNYWDSGSGQPLIPADRSKHGLWMERSAVVTSGSLVSLAAYDAIGPFMSYLFIDQVDVEYCLRARARGFRVLLSLEPAMSIRLAGTAARYRVGYGLHAGLPAVPVVLYRRNYVIVARKYFLREPLGLTAGFVYTAIRFAKVLWLEDDRRSKIARALSGLIDGWRSEGSIEASAGSVGIPPDPK